MSLIELSLENISISQAPDLALPNLRVLSLSHNELPSIPPELAANLTSLRELDLSENDLTTIPLITHSLENLRALSMAGNPLTSLSNTSLLGAADTLEHLDIANLQLMSIEVCRGVLKICSAFQIFFHFQNGILNKLKNLRSLRLSTYPGLSNFNIPTILEDVDNLRELWIEAPAPKLTKIVTKEGLETYQMIQDPASDLRMELQGELPRKVKSLTISGAGFNRLADGILDVNVNFFDCANFSNISGFSGSSSIISAFDTPQHNAQRFTTKLVRTSRRSLQHLAHDRFQQQEVQHHSQSEHGAPSESSRQGSSD